MTHNPDTQDLLNAIGNTLIRLRAVSEATGCDIFGKAEFMNPADRSRIVPRLPSSRTRKRAARFARAA